ncbi:hypothetical protein LCGC14_1529470, partial [marine sediment metagenome]
VGERIKETLQRRQSVFFERKNVPTKPKEPVVGSSTPDIIEKGKSFFRKTGEV